MKDLKKLLSYTLGYKLPTLFNICFNILAALFELTALLIFMPFLKLMFEKNIKIVTQKPDFSFSDKFVIDYFNWFINHYIGTENKNTILISICALIILLFLLKNIFRYLALAYIAIFRNGIVRDIRMQIYKKINNLPLTYFSESRKGDIITRVSNDVQVLEFSILTTLEVLFRDPVMIVLSLAIMINMNPYLTLFSMVLLPISGLVIGRLGKSLKRSSYKVQNQLSDIVSMLEETLFAIKIIMGFNAQQLMNRKFKYKNQLFYKHALKMSRKQDLASPLSEFMGSLVMITLVYYGGSLVLNEEIKFTGERFIVYILIFARLLPPIKQMVSAYTSLQKGAASSERIEQILKESNPIKNPIDPIPFKTFKQSIIYENIYFSYPEQAVFKNFNLEIKKGTSVAFVGSSGSGKSTLSNLLFRFYDPQKGTLKIDGIDIKNFNLEDLRKQIGIVTQDSILFNDSVANNITFGSKNIDKKRIIMASKAANAQEFIETLPKKYEQTIGDGGNQLSGGQKQRLCIARAIYKNPDILVLDEATSALDTKSEKLVQTAIQNLMKNRTSIVIAHRLSTIKNVDEIIVFKHGEILEKGSHKELFDKKGEYHALYKAQNQ